MEGQILAPAIMMANPRLQHLLSRFQDVVLYSSMVASVDVTLLLEGIDASIPASVRAPTRPCALLGCSPPYLVVGMATLLPLGLCKHYLLSGAHHQRLALLFSTSLECFVSSYAGWRGP